MTVPLTAVQDAVYARLSAAIAGWPVYQHVPENSQLPYIVLGDIEAAPGETKGADALTFELEFFFRGKGRRPMLAKMHEARLALHGQPIAAEGIDLDAPRWASSATVKAEDGITYVGLQEYTVEAEPA